MTVFCDTSVLVAACLSQHPHYARARPVLEAVARGRDQGVISTHTLAEMFSALTSLPLTPRVLPADARAIVTRNVWPHFRAVTVTAEMYLRAIEACVARGLGRGKVYDALLLECAREADPERILTFNVADFLALAPDLAGRIAAP